MYSWNNPTSTHTYTKPGLRSTSSGPEAQMVPGHVSWKNEFSMVSVRFAGNPISLVFVFIK